MAARGFRVKIQLDLQAVTCPGVWLCPNGEIAVRIKALGSSFESRRVAPAFPLLLHQQFILRKIFGRVAGLTELQRYLDREPFYAELFQWTSPSTRRIVLATFESSLTDLLYPAPCFKRLLAGVDVDLLMEPSKYFPGIIAPKIELSTKTVIEEVLGVHEACSNGPYIVNPKTINSKPCPPQRKRPNTGIIRQRRVCHARGKSKPQIGRAKYHSEAAERPEIGKCYHALTKKPNCCCELPVKENDYKTDPNLREHDAHRLDDCPVCSKYTCYFSGNYGESKNDVSTELGKTKNVDQIVNSCLCKPSHAVPCPSSPLRSRSGQRLTEKRRDENDYKLVDVSECNCCCECDEDWTERGFYKNLERFYKRMYKQAKMRARQADS